LTAAVYPRRKSTSNAWPRAWESGSAAAARLLDLPEPPTAIMATNTFLSMGVIREIHRRELKMAEDISFMMFDDPEWASLHTPGSLPSASRFRRSARRAFQLLEARMLKRKTGDREESIFPDYSYPARSCGPARN
jgi:DNA-binding LacI/PurR family transcriptional regulator